MMNKNTEIKKCRSCNSENLINILSLGEQYLSDFFIDNKKPKKFPLDLVLCEKCNLVQLKNSTPQKLLYTPRYGYRSGINSTMRNELKRIVETSKNKIKTDKIITALDIGANDGTLLSFYCRNDFKIAVEPIRKFALECGKRADVVVNDFFNYGSYVKKLNNTRADIITAISCFYDMENPNEFVSDVKKILKKNGIFVISQNYLVGMLRNNAFDNIVHEHLEYYSLLSLEQLMARHDLEVFDLEKTMTNGGSFVTYISHKNTRSIKKSVFDLRKSEKALGLNDLKVYLNFAKRVINNSKELHGLISKLVKEKKKVYVYGASTRGNTLLQYYKLNNRLIEYAVERNPEKWGKKISSLNIPIISEDDARRLKPDYMLVLPWFFKEEFLQREKNYLDSGGHFIFPLPRIQMI
jgi:NDP-4-keto-2,6-dideoxyhexose 3-C-methyltransferase